MVFQIEDLRETSPFKRLFRPRAILLLGVKQPVDAAFHLVTVGFASRDQSQQCPGSLRCGRFADAGLCGVVVTSATFTPRSAGLLHAPQPRSGPRCKVLPGRKRRFGCAQKLKYGVYTRAMKYADWAGKIVAGERR